MEVGHCTLQAAVYSVKVCHNNYTFVIPDLMVRDRK